MSIQRLSGHLPIRRMSGLSYVEVLVSTVLITISLLPAMDAFMPGAKAVIFSETRVEDRYQLSAKLEQVLAASFTDLDAAANAAGSPLVASSYSDVVTYTNGRQITRNVFLSRYDGDNADANNNPFNGIDAGLIWVRVEIDGTPLSFESLISDSD